MVKDTSLYDILEISPDASDSDIVKAYKKMAFKYLPGGDDSSNEESFKKISDACYVLSNLERRQDYDENGIYEIDDYNPVDFFMSIGAKEFSSGMLPNISNIQSNQLKAPPLRIPVSLSLEESFFGAKKKVVFKRMIGDSTVDYGSEPPPPDKLVPQNDELEIDIPKGSAPGSTIVFQDKGHDIPNVGKSDLICVLVDEDEYNFNIKDQLEKKGVLDGTELEELEDEDDEQDDEDDADDDEQDEDEDDEQDDDEDEEKDDDDEQDDDEDEDLEDGEDDYVDDEDSMSSVSSVEEDGKYKFTRGENNELDLTLKINLKELYCGVERSVKYFGGKNINIGHYDKIDPDQLYCIPGLGINGADMNVRFHLKMPRKIPDEHKQEFIAVMDKICKNRNTTDFSKLESNDIKSLILKDQELDDDYDDEDNNNYGNQVQCPHQ